jgi:RNA polymerase sigma-70 factor (ECF subfamily)
MPPPIHPTNPAEQSVSKWFTAEVLPHEPALKGYLRRAFPAVRDVEDVVQESYLRLWKAEAAVPANSVTAFLFRVARNVMVDRYRRGLRRRESVVGTLAVENVIDDEADVVEAVSTHEKELLLVAALASLPSRAHEVVILCKLEGLSHNEAARRLGISKRTVDEHLRRGMKRLGEELRRRSLQGYFKT